MPDKHLVLFDIDGTLLHSKGCGRAATTRALQEVFGSTGGLDQVNFAGKTDWQILLEALTPAGISAEHIQSQLAVYNQVVVQHLTDLIDDFPVQPCVGAREVVAALRSHPDVLLGLVTGNMPGLVPHKLRAARYDPADFKVGAFGSEGWERAMLPPLALRRANAWSNTFFAAEQVVVIGDTPGDIMCAASIQARTIAVATGPFSVTELQAYQPDHVFETMAERDSVLVAILHNGQVS